MNAPRHTDRGWALLAWTGLVAAHVACGGSSSAGDELPSDDPAAAPAATATSAPDDSSEPPRTVEDGGSTGDGGDGGPACATKWALASRGAPWDPSYGTVQIAGGQLDLSVKANAPTAPACSQVALCAPIKVSQQVTGDFEASIELKAAGGTVVGTTPNATIPVAGIWVEAIDAKNFNHHAYLQFRKDGTNAGAYDITSGGGEVQPGGSTTGDARNVKPSGVLTVKRVGETITLTADFVETGGKAGKVVSVRKLGAGVAAAGPLRVGVYVAANTVATNSIDRSATFDNFVVKSGAGLAGDDFACDSLP